MSCNHLVNQINTLDIEFSIVEFATIFLLLALQACKQTSSGHFQNPRDAGGVSFLLFNRIYVGVFVCKRTPD